MHQLQGFLDGAMPQPNPFVLLANGVKSHNPPSVLWLQIDQLVRAWIFAAIPKDSLTDIYELPHCRAIGQHLESWFNTGNLTHRMDLQLMLTNLDKLESQSMEDFLRDVKTLANSLAATQALIWGLALV